MALSDADLALYTEEYLVEEDEDRSKTAVQYYLGKYLA